MEQLVTAILRGMAARRISREELAHRAGVSISSLNKILAGHRAPTPSGLIKIGQALDIELLELSPARDAAIAPPELGAYTRSSVAWMEGAYLAVRHSFQAADQIIAFALTVEWDHEARCLTYATSDDFSGPALQRGRVSHSTRTGHSYLIASDQGRFDLTILGRPGEQGRLHGLCTTVIVQRGFPTPASSGIALLPVEPADPPPRCGPFSTDDERHGLYKDLLTATERDGFARIVSAMPSP